MQPCRSTSPKPKPTLLVVAIILPGANMMQDWRPAQKWSTRIGSSATMSLPFNSYVRELGDGRVLVKLELQAAYPQHASLVMRGNGGQQ